MIKELSFFSKSEVLTKEKVNDFSKGAFSLDPYFNVSDLNPNSRFEITFSSRIVSVRTSSYEWTSDYQFYIAGFLSPKILRLENGICVQANCTLGFWEIDPKNNYRLLWHLNPDNSRI